MINELITAGLFGRSPSITLPRLGTVSSGLLGGFAQVVIDGDSDPIAHTTTTTPCRSTVPLSAGDRVIVELIGRTRIVTGVLGGAPKRYTCPLQPGFSGLVYVEVQGGRAFLHMSVTTTQTFASSPLVATLPAQVSPPTTSVLFVAVGQYGDEVSSTPAWVTPAGEIAFSGYSVPVGQGRHGMGASWAI